VQIWPGRPYPLGATYDGSGVNFALFSEIADAVDLCLIDDDGAEERIRLPEVDGFVWHGYLPGLQPGQRYGFRVHGPYAPLDGHRCDPTKLLLDPYARAIDGTMDGDPSLFSYPMTDVDRGTAGERNEVDSLGHTLLSVVVNPFFDWGQDRAPRHEYHNTVIYEAHVKGMTMLHPDIPEEIRGTYAGMGHPAIIAHLVDLGITAVELMPVHQFVNDFHLQDKGQVLEFKAMVKALHEAGIEVILDVVYNHTAEGNHSARRLSFRGLDNAAYYRSCRPRRRATTTTPAAATALNMRTRTCSS
jgi:isoamylase